MFYLIFSLLLSASGLYDFSVKSIDGKATKLSEYKGKVVLIVNVASECGYTPQYEGLQALYEKYSDKGFVVLGFPCNDFGGQEPGTNESIKAFCSSKFNVTFPMFEKVSMSHPLYKHLTETAPSKGPVKWNFEKFLINKKGEIVGRYKSGVRPLSDELTAAVEAALAETK